MDPPTNDRGGGRMEPADSETPSPDVTDTMFGENRGNQQNVVGDHNTPTFHEEFLRYQVQAT